MKTILLFTMVLLVFPANSGSARADEGTPDTVDYGRLFVQAINSDSEVEQRALLNRSFTSGAIATTGMDRLMQLVRRLRTDLAPLAYHHSEVNEFRRPAGTVYVMHIYTRKQGAVMWTDIQMYLDAGEPHRLASIAFVAEVAEPVNLPNGDIEDGATRDWLNGYIDKLISENDLSGSILVVKGTERLFERYFGYADVNRSIPVTRATLFNVASGGKMFTALAIAQLVERGKLRYDDPVTQYLGGFTDRAKADKITVHHLLSHTSGIGEYWAGQSDEKVSTATSINDHLKLVYEAGFDFDAGTAYAYCNSNFILLGAIIEKTAGGSFYDTIRENIFAKAAMKTAGYYEHGSSNTAVPLARGAEGKGWVEAAHGVKGSSAGGAYASVDDIANFSRALQQNTLVSRKTFEHLVAVKNDGLNAREEYGYGFIISRHEGSQRAFGHGGTAAGVNFEFRYFPRQDVTLVLFCNQNNGAYDDLRKNSTKLITGER